MGLLSKIKNKKVKVTGDENAKGGVDATPDSVDASTEATGTAGGETGDGQGSADGDAGTGN